MNPKVTFKTLLKENKWSITLLTLLSSISVVFGVVILFFSISKYENLFLLSIRQVIKLPQNIFLYNKKRFENPLIYDIIILGEVCDMKKIMIDLIKLLSV